VFGNGDVCALAIMEPTFGWWKNAHLRRERKRKKESLSHGFRPVFSSPMSASFYLPPKNLHRRSMERGSVEMNVLLVGKEAKQVVPRELVGMSAFGQHRLVTP